MLTASVSPLHPDRNWPNLTHLSMFRPTGKGVPVVLLPARRSGSAALPNAESPLTSSDGDVASALRGGSAPPSSAGLASLHQHPSAVPAQHAETSKAGAARYTRSLVPLRRIPPPAPLPLPEQIPTYLLSAPPVAAFRRKKVIPDVAISMRRSRSRSQPKKALRLADLQQEILPRRHDGDYFRPNGTECMTGRLDESSSIFRLPHFLGWKAPTPDRLRLVQLGGDTREGKRSERARTPFELVPKTNRPQSVVGVDASCFVPVLSLAAVSHRKREVDLVVEGTGQSSDPKADPSRPATSAVQIAEGIPSIQVTPAPSTAPHASQPVDASLLVPRRPRIRRKVLERAAKAYAFEQTGRTVGVETWEARMDFENLGRDLGETIV